MPIELQSVTFVSRDPERDAEFWGAILGRSGESDAGGTLLAGQGGQVGIRFAAGPSHGSARNPLHLHLSEVDGRGQADTIAACVKLGARLRGNGHVPENSYAAMADVVGDEFCVIEDGNGYLAGCGPLGEVTCEGTRAVGHFWSDALAWPLVWEVGEETAIQSPAGGTKISWGGEPVGPEPAPERQYFVLTVAHREFDDEVDRLLALGASERATASGGMTLSDPDGRGFVLRAVDAERAPSRRERP